jgi:hypothetical protein
MAVSHAAAHIFLVMLIEAKHLWAFDGALRE